jgi:hypothetical protein
VGDERRNVPSADEPPPVLGAWWRWYVLVVGNLVLLIALFWLFMKAFE